MEPYHCPNCGRFMRLLPWKDFNAFWAWCSKCKYAETVFVYGP